ncbi:MAG: hypothetical protein OXG79_12350 [Chloroflexi bacterium]|nr:hypothetical protein [Chloroflexota bacterium]
MSWRLLIASTAALAVAVAVALIGCGELALKTTADVQCEDLIPDVVRISEENKHPLRPTILKVYDAKEVSRSSSRLECEGSAKTSFGDDQPLIFYLEEDADGDRFVGYEGKE